MSLPSKHRVANHTSTWPSVGPMWVKKGASAAKVVRFLDSQSTWSTCVCIAVSQRHRVSGLVPGRVLCTAGGDVVAPQPCE